MRFNSVLFLGRYNCNYSIKLKKFLKKKSKKFQYIESKKYGVKLDKSKIKKKQYDFIFSFRSFYIIKPFLLERCKVAAINFHLGPPEYRGIGCINYALYEKAKFYGCTAHIINEKIDKGKIIDVKKFRILKSDNLEVCLKKTHKFSFYQAIRLCKSILRDKNFIINSIKKNSKLKWSKKIWRKKDLDNFYKINIKSTKLDIMNRIRATYTKNYKPYIYLKNKNIYSINFFQNRQKTVNFINKVKLRKKSKNFIDLLI